MRAHVACLSACLSAGPVLAANDPAALAEKRSYTTERALVAPRVDGRLDDAAWDQVAWEGGFLQREPTEGAPASRETRFKVLYDDEAVYFAIRAEDDPQAVSRLLARRDRFPGDWIEINIDSYFDRRTAFSFTLSLSGARGDEFVSADGNRWDGNWDPVWQGATQVDELGWTAEIRIPLSQLRFSATEEQTWGLQVQRRIFRQEERSTWQRIPKDGTGWVSRFGELRGIRGLAPKRRVELLPYAVARGERFQKVPGNPFRDGGEGSLSGGLDGKLGLTSNLTLDFTLNPDFGQVEADPSEVNLTAFETFFEEKRPFFIEGNSILDLRVAPAIAGSHFTRDRLFYSRRIGVAPPYSPELADGEHADLPAYSSILGAFKLSGKTASGLSIGILNSVTSRETAIVDLAGQRRHLVVAPATNSFVGRVQQDLRGGDTQVGLMLTAVNRKIDDDPLRFLTGQAYAGGLDFAHYLVGRNYLLEGSLVASHLRGTSRALEDAQTSSARYFQRPDHDRETLDSSRTSLSGHAGSLRLMRTSNNSRFMYQTGAAWRSAGFEINDLGFMTRGDEINQFGWAAYQMRDAKGPFRRVEINLNEWLDWDYGGQPLRQAVNTNGHLHFNNNWRVGGSLTREGERTSNTELRGGPQSRWPGRVSWDLYTHSDERRDLMVSAGIRGSRDDENSGRARKLWTDATVRPTNALTLTLSPSISRDRPEMQYVGTASSSLGDRYLFGRLDQETSALTFRIDFSLTPNLTVQYYGAPFVASGRYSELKRIVAPRADRYRDRFRLFVPGEIATGADGAYSVDETGDGSEDYRFSRPDFDVRDFNSTLVARWEYRPGSLVYAVWSQARSDEALAEAQGPSFGRGLRQIWSTHPHDVFLIKFSTWLPF